MELDGPQSFKWSKDGGISFVNEKLAIDGTAQSLAYGVSITMDATPNHYAIGDRWSFSAIPTNVPVTVYRDSNGSLVDIVRTRNSLHRELSNLYDADRLSLRISVDDNGSVIYLNQAMDKLLIDSISVTGSSLKNEGGTLVYINNDFDEDGNLDNIIYSQSQDNSLGEPFGITFEANQSGTYFIYAIAEDYYGNQVASTSSLVTVSTSVGQVPAVELGTVEQYMTYSKCSYCIPSAEANDPDGSISEVIFYANGLEVGVDSSRPFESNFEINATGHYEVYAVARDNSEIWDQCRRIVVMREGRVRKYLLRSPHKLHS